MTDSTATPEEAYYERARASYGEAWSILKERYATKEGLSSVFHGASDYARKHPVRSAMLASGGGLALTASTAFYGVIPTIAQGIGLGAFLLARESATFKNHRHIIAVSSMSTALASMQQGMMAGASPDPGNYLPGLYMLMHATGTLASFAVIPEDKKLLRNAVMWGGGILGAAGAAWTASAYGESTGYIPAVTTMLNSVLFATSDANTPRARLGYLTATTSHFVYWLTQPVASLGLLATEAVYSVTHASSICQHDMPHKESRDEEPMSWKQKLGHYFTTLAKGKNAERKGLTRSDLGLERIDDKIYRKTSEFVLGA